MDQNWSKKLNMDILNNIFDKLSPLDLHRLGLTSIKYDYPIKSRSGDKPRFWQNDVSHIGLQSSALDFIIPHPLEKGSLPIYMPADGTIVEIVQNNDKWGGRDFERYLNQLVAITENGEYFRIAHIRKNSCEFSVGSNIKQGIQIAETGVNGWMTDPRHSHFEVGIVIAGQRKTLKIRWSGF